MNFKDANGHPNYAIMLAILAAIVFVAVNNLTAIGREAKGIEFTPEVLATPIDTNQEVAP